jgi:hypothetical protein
MPDYLLATKLSKYGNIQRASPHRPATVLACSATRRSRSRDRDRGCLVAGRHFVSDMLLG